jgi:hypothetical protein
VADPSFTYELGFKHQPRGIVEHGLTGPDLQDRDHPEDDMLSADGRWFEDRSELDDDLEFVMQSVINEAVHEALEWLRRDGQLVLDPHGRYQLEILETSGNAASALAALVRGGP